MNLNALHGFGRYTRFIARRERLSGLLWLVGLVFVTAAVTAMYPSIFGTDAELLGLGYMLETPGMAAIMGPAYGLRPGIITPTMLMAQEMLLWLFLVVAVMNIFFINRLTRRDEERGRLEMLRGLPLGRLTNAASALFSAFILNMAVSVAMTAALTAVNAPGTTLAGALSFSLAIGILGFFFAAIALLAAQLSSTERGASALAFLIMGALYLIRAAADASYAANGGSDTFLACVSPMGLGLRVFSFYENNFWPLLIIFIEAAVIAAAALFICSRRDLGEGIVPARKGRVNAPAWMLSPLGLIWRLSRGGFIAWFAAFLALGLSYGTVLGDLDSFLGSNDTFSQIIIAGMAEGVKATMAEGYVAMVFMLMSIVASVPVIGAVTKAVSEERRGRMEQIYGRAVSRAGIFLSCIAVAVAESLAMPLAIALGAYAVSAGLGIIPPAMYFKAALVYAPAMLAFAGLAALLAGLWPRLKSLIWVYLGYSLFVLWLGRVLKLPDFFAKLTPYGHIAQIPVQEFKALPLIILSAIAVALAAAGVIGYGKRDIGAS